MIRKKILFYYMRGGTAGGSDTCLFLLLKYLDQMEFEPYLMYYENSAYVEKLKEIGIKLIPFSKQIYTKQKIKDNKNSRKHSNRQTNKLRLFLGSLKKTIKKIPESIKYANIIKRYNIDVIHTNHHLTGDRAMILASLFTRKPVISHNRGLYKPDLIDKYISKYIYKIICISDFSKNVYTNNGISEEKCITIYDGIEVEKLTPPKDESEDIIIGCFGRLEKWKGQQTLIEAAEKIVKIKSGIKFIFVGNGDNEEELKNQVKQKVLGKFIEFTGYVTNVTDYMNKCSIIVHTSVEPEPFGMVIIEAMVLKKLVIATNLGGPKEIIDNGKNGYLISAQDPSILANQITTFLDNPNRRTKIEENARQKVIAKFNIRDSVKQIEKVYG